MNTAPALVPDGTPLRRMHHCHCGAEFEQNGLEAPITNVVRWFPSECGSCASGKRENADRFRQSREKVARHGQLRAAIEGLRVPPLYADATLDTFELHGSPEDQRQQEVLRGIAADYVRAWPRVSSLIVFAGAPGTGKGHIAWSVAKALAETGIRGRVVKCAAMVRELRASWSNPQADPEEKVLARLTEIPFLVIDEVSRHAFYGQQIHQHLYDVLDNRSEYERPTILTTNEDAAGLAEILRPALIDRLNGYGQIIEFPSASWRSRGVES